VRGCRFIRDKDERDLDFPIVSVLLGLPLSSSAVIAGPTARDESQRAMET
jgi:hypothetical protein